MFKKDILVLIGNYNAGNIGDNMLLKASLKGICDNLPRWKVKIVAPSKPADSLILPTGIRSLLRIGWLKTLYYYAVAKVAVFGGGGLLNVEEYRSLLIWGLQIFVLKLFKTEVYLIANSVTPSDSKLLRNILNRVDLISVRDKESFDFLNKLSLEIPIRKTADLAFSLCPNNYMDNCFEFDFEEFIVINLRDYAAVSPELQFNILNAIVGEVLSRTQLGVYLLPFDKGDVPFLRRISSEFEDNGRVITLPLDTEVLLRAVAQAKVVVSQRLHPLIFAFLLKKPLVALSYSSKVGSLFSELIEDDLIFDLQNIELSAQNVTDVVMRLLSEDQAEYDNNLESLLSKQKKEAELNFSFLKNFINKN